MCGIIGIIGQDPVAPLLVEGLKRLEYRGYDSAGIATLTNGAISRCRAEGKLVNLEMRLEETQLSGTTGIGHTRWATHGRPTENNAHPHADDRVALVHNGIIENFQELRQELQGLGHAFETETDTEVVVHSRLADSEGGAGVAHALRHRHEHGPHPRGGGPAVLGHPRTHPPDRGQGAAQAQAPQPLAAFAELPRHLSLLPGAFTGKVVARRGRCAMEPAGRAGSFSALPSPAPAPGRQASEPPPPSPLTPMRDGLPLAWAVGVECRFPACDCFLGYDPFLVTTLGGPVVQLVRTRRS